MDQGFSREVAGIIDEELCGKRIHAVNHHVVGRDIVHGIGRGKPIFVRFHGHVGIQEEHFFFRRLHLGPSDVGSMVKHLSLQIGPVNHVAVDQSDRSDAGRGQIQGDRRTEPPGPDHKHFRPGNFLLPLPSDLGQQDVPAVSGDLFFRETHIDRLVRY